MDFFNEFLDKNNLKKVEVADYLGISKQSVSLMSSGAQKVSSKTLAKLREHPTWDVSMLPLPDEKSRFSPSSAVLSSRKEGKVKRIPILHHTAVAGYLSGNNGADVANTDEFISFIDFFERHADFAIRVDGDSMYPRYNSGDVLACRILYDKNLFDFGRVYVLNTRNGCVIKKVIGRQGDSVVCHSENPAYPDYPISVDDILGVAVVVGHAGVE